MDKATRNILIAIGIVVVGGGAYLFFTRDKDKKGKGKGKKNKNYKSFNMGYLQGLWIHISGNDRAEATKYLKKGTKVIIDGGSADMNGERTISELWTDSNGNLGAFKTEEFTIPYVPDGTKNRDYEDKATISVKL